MAERWFCLEGVTNVEIRKIVKGCMVIFLAQVVYLRFVHAPILVKGWFHLGKLGKQKSQYVGIGFY